MGTETLSLDLYKANVELQLRITRLLQESAHQWLEAAQRASTEGISEVTAEIEGLLRTANWQSLATLPSESFWRLFQQRTSNAQLINQIAVKNQAAFTSGLQQALESWQKSVTAILGNANAAQPLQDALKQWGGAWTAAATPSQAKSTKGG